MDPKADVPPPSWIRHVPELPGTRFFVGESQGSPSKEDALEKAWVSAFIRIGMTQFPELAIVSSESTETLKRAAYERHFVMQLEKVNWQGIREASEYGSPYVDWNADAGTYVVYRLLKWRDRDLSAARSEIKLARLHEIPSSPESVRMNEAKMIHAVRAIQALNAKVERRNHLLEKVFGEIKCGVTLTDLVNILGPPDRSNPFNGLIVEKEYSWGQFTVGRVADDPMVAVVTRQDEREDRRVVCPGRLLNE
jgi:hypothetical protein